MADLPNQIINPITQEARNYSPEMHKPPYSSTRSQDSNCGIRTKIAFVTNLKHHGLKILVFSLALERFYRDSLLLRPTSAKGTGIVIIQFHSIFRVFLIFIFEYFFNKNRFPTPMVQGFIIDRTYRLVDSKPKVYLFGRLDTGESFLTISDYQPYFYFRTADRKNAEELVNFIEVIDTDMKNFSGEAVSKAVVSEPKVVGQVRKILEEQGIPCYEADLPFTQQFLMDHEVLSTLEIEGPSKKGHEVDKIFENPKINVSAHEIPLRVLSIDLEASNANNGDLYSISLVGKTLNGEGPSHDEVLFISNKETHKGAAAEKIVDLKATVLPDEKTLLKILTKRIKEYDPDIITGWNVIDFDLAFLKQKYDNHDMDFAWGRTEWPNRLRLESSYARDSKADIAGRMVLDGIQLLRSSFINLDDYKLDTAAHELLGEKKLIGGKNKVQEIIDSYHEDPEKLVEYNRKDSELVLKILEKQGIITLTILRSTIVGLPLERVKASIASLDSLYLRELHKKNIVAPTGGFVEKERGITGGYVMASKPGIYDWVVVLDFKSLYPSVMRTFNIDPLDHRPDCEAREGEELIRAPNNTCFVKRDGILSELLQRIWDQRDAAKKRNDPTGSMAFKILMNSFFGVMASPNCRFFSMELANAITNFAQKFIKLTVTSLEEKGLSVIYGDTDSVFVNLEVSSKEEAIEQATRIQDEMNKELDSYIKKEYGVPSYLELEFEKTYRKFLMPRVRGREQGSKKRYAGLKITDAGESMDFTGLEFVRRDWTELAKEFQLTLLEKIFHEEPVEEYVRNFVKDLKKGEYDNLLVYRKAVRKELESYTKTTPPHVKAARKLVDQVGRLNSPIIEYVMTQSGPEPVGYESSSLDYEHYLDKQVRPIADAVLCFFDTTLDDIMAGSSQTTLGGF